MKAILLNSLFLLLPRLAAAQYFLWGTYYFQNFNSIAAGLPAGWEVDTAASVSQKGFPAVYDPTPTGWTSPSTTAGKFKNVASATGHPVYAGFTSALQAADTNRSLGVRQVAAADAGVAFVFRIDNTAGLSNLQMSVRLQSLDSTSQRTAKWRIDCAAGNNPTLWTKAPQQWGDSTTGGFSYSDSTLYAAFGTLLDNQPGPVWIRIVTIAPTTGANSRPTTAIDNFALTWSGAAAGPLRPAIDFTLPANGATLVSPSAIPSITFNRNIDTGAGNIYLKEEISGTTQIIAPTPGNVTISGKSALLNAAVLAPGGVYHITFDSTAFDTGQYTCAGLYDTTAWRFETVPIVPDVAVLQENFDGACLPPGWTRYSVSGPQEWQCYTPPGGTKVVRLQRTASTPVQNEDWLCSPRITTTGTTRIGFSSLKRGSGPDLKVYQSENYIGYGDPAAAVWTPLPFALPGDTGVWRAAQALVSPAMPYFLAFVYAATDSNAFELRIDSVNVQPGVSAGSLPAQPMLFTAHAEHSSLTIRISGDHSGPAQLCLRDLRGTILLERNLYLSGSETQHTFPGLSLSSGIYMLHLKGSHVQQTRKLAVW